MEDGTLILIKIKKESFFTFIFIWHVNVSHGTSCVFMSNYHYIWYSITHAKKSAICLMSSGVVRQQPPINFAPASIHSGTRSVKVSA